MAIRFPNDSRKFSRERFGAEDFDRRVTRCRAIFPAFLEGADLSFLVILRINSIKIDATHPRIAQKIVTIAREDQRLPPLFVEFAEFKLNSDSVAEFSVRGRAGGDG